MSWARGQEVSLGPAAIEVVRAQYPILINVVVAARPTDGDEF
jgi:hypothetical protein